MCPSGTRRRMPTVRHKEKGNRSPAFARAARVQPRGCKGRSPLHKITLSPPLSRRGRGSGGYPSPSGKGGESKAKGRVGRRQSSHAPPPGTTAAGQNGGKEGKPPAGYHSGRAERRQSSHAPRHHPKQHGKSGTGCRPRRQTIKYREKFLGVWGLLSRSPQRFSASPLLCSPSPADYPFRLQSCMALFTSPETRHSIPRQATGKRSERRESSEGEKSERTQAARS